MTRYWFRPKRFGYGATPITWEGWLATTAFAAAVVVGMLELIHWMQLAPTGAVPVWMVAAGLAALFALIFGFVRFSEYKTDGKWKWRWGDQD